MLEGRAFCKGSCGTVLMCHIHVWEHRDAEDERSFAGCSQVGQNRSSTGLVHGQGLLLTTCSVAEKAMESEQTHEMFTECPLSVSDFSVLSVTKRTWQDTISQFLQWYNKVFLLKKELK